MSEEEKLYHAIRFEMKKQEARQRPRYVTIFDYEDEYIEETQGDGAQGEVAEHRLVSTVHQMSLVQ